jgi:hypothetical protein
MPVTDSNKMSAWNESKNMREFLCNRCSRESRLMLVFEK